MLSSVTVWLVNAENHCFNAVVARNMYKRYIYIWERTIYSMLRQPIYTWPTYLSLWWEKEGWNKLVCALYVSRAERASNVVGGFFRSLSHTLSFPPGHISNISAIGGGAFSNAKKQKAFTIFASSTTNGFVGGVILWRSDDR